MSEPNPKRRIRASPFVCHTSTSCSLKGNLLAITCTPRKARSTTRRKSMLLICDKRSLALLRCARVLTRKQQMPALVASILALLLLLGLVHGASCDCACARCLSRGLAIADRLRSTQVPLSVSCERRPPAHPPSPQSHAFGRLPPSGPTAPLQHHHSHVLFLRYRYTLPTSAAGGQADGGGGGFGGRGGGLPLQRPGHGHGLGAGGAADGAMRRGRRGGASPPRCVLVVVVLIDYLSPISSRHILPLNGYRAWIAHAEADAEGRALALAVVDGEEEATVLCRREDIEGMYVRGGRR